MMILMILIGIAGAILFGVAIALLYVVAELEAEREHTATPDAWAHGRTLLDRARRSHIHGER